MEYVLIFAVGTVFGFVAAWILLRSTLKPSQEITAQYGALGEQLRSLNETTSQLQRVLVDRTSRGKWGERRALKVLELAGFVENKDYRYQKVSTNDDGKRIIPDFTFEFPNQIVLHMDSKFPLEQYEAYVNANDEHSRQEHLKGFLKAVRGHVKDLDTKGYVSPGSQTVDFVLLFIPFESLFRFIHEQDETLIDDALERHVVLCSPLTLYVLLSTIRRSIDTFAYSQAATEIRSAIEQVRTEWDNYGGKLDELGNRLKGAQDSFNQVTSTRDSQLQRAYNRINKITDKYRTFQDDEKQ